MSIDGRLNKLAPALTAKERAILALRAWKEGVPEDPGLRSKMPAHQHQEFNRYMRLMMGAHHYQILYVLILSQSLELLSARYAYLLALHQWALSAMGLGAYIASRTKEPITRTEYRQRLVAAREEMVPASEFAEILADEYKDWTDEDLESHEGDEGPLVKPAAWKRLCGEKALELARLVEQGTLAGRREGSRLLVQAGSFYDWLGEPVPVLPDWGFEFEIHPDTKATEVRRLRQARQGAKEAMQRAPLGLGLDLISRTLGVSPKDPAGGNKVAQALITCVREGIQLRWQELLAVEQVLEEVAMEFDGEDLARPQDRQVIIGGKEKLKQLHAAVQDYVGPFELPGPVEEQVWLLRRKVWGAAEG